MTSIVWFRSDLRLSDNPALAAAAARQQPIVPVFIWSPAEEGEWQFGGATKWWLHHSLLSFQGELAKYGLTLIIRVGAAQDVLAELISQSAVTHLYWNRRYEPAAKTRDTELKERFRGQGLVVESFNSALLLEPWEGTKEDKSPYQVYTPFWKNAVKRGFGREPLPVPSSMVPCAAPIVSATVESLALLPKIGWDSEFSTFWKPGRTGAEQALSQFLSGRIERYGSSRDQPYHPGTSRLSPHLHFGEISPHEVLVAVRRQFGESPKSKDVETYIKELVWREFGYHLLHFFPETPTRPLRREFEKFPWQPDAALLRAWQKGMTGYPIVDAGMRELWRTGWMHNRVRMIVASLLVKHLLIPWQEGARWFWDTLVDADLASNTLGWQWAGGCGADAAPYFRIFNPVLQGEKFDPDGAYVKRWCPELARVPAKHLHRIFEAPPEILAAAGVTLGVEYPKPIVDLFEGRDRALAAYAELRGERGE